MAMHYLTHRTFQKQKSMNGVSNRFRIHRILQTWPQATIRYYLFPNLKRWPCGRRFKSNEKVEWETTGYFGGFDKAYYFEGIGNFKDRWIRCIELKGK